MRVPCFRFDQPGASFYACVLPAEFIAGRLDIRRRSDGSEGVQRDEDPKRVRGIADYLRGVDAILPTPIVVSAYEGQVKVLNGEMIIEDGVVSVGHILDGQHRILGIREGGSEVSSNFDLLFVFAFEVDIYAQATVFSTINSNQRQVSKSLIYDLFGLDPRRSRERMAHEVVRSLNDDEASPFHKRIKILGKKVEETETLSQAAFIDHLLDAMRRDNSKLELLYQDKEDWVVQKIISNCFWGVLRAGDEVDNSYPEDYFFKTTGYGGVMKSLNSLIFSGWASGSVDQSFFKTSFVRFMERFPNPPEGTGNSAMLQISRNIKIANGFSG